MLTVNEEDKPKKQLEEDVTSLIQPLDLDQGVIATFKRHF